MNDGAAWEHSHRIEPPTPTAQNPWASLHSSQEPFQPSNRSTSNLLTVTDEYVPRGRSTSLAGGSSSTTITYATSRLASSEREGDSLLASGIRPRIRRQRSEIGSQSADGVVKVDEDQGFRTNSYSKPSSSVMYADSASANGSTPSLSSYAPTSASSTPKRPLQSRKMSNTLSNDNQPHPRDTQPSGNSFISPEAVSDPWDWDANDKTREGKARTALVQGKGKQRAGLAGPFSSGLKTVFGSKLWGEVETLWNEAISPISGYDPSANGGQGGHAYLDVWGRPISKPPDAELGRGRDTRPARVLEDINANEARRVTGPLEENDISQTTTPSLSRRTTRVERETPKTLVSDAGVDILGEIEGTKANDTGEAEVFEHKVLPTDSLAGVALKYGITVAQLRKCNKMWASDTIHLRKVLYIPVSSVNTGNTGGNLVGRSGELIDLSPRRQRRQVSQGNVVDSSPSKSDYGISSSPSGSNVSLSASTSSLTPSKSLNSTPSMKKVPLSELSYFPPPSVPSTSIFTSNPHPSTISAGTMRRWELENGVTSTPFSTLGPPGPSPGLTSSSRTTSPSRSPLPTSIFNVFPSLNELNITSRVSFETVRSASGSTPGSGNVSGDEDVELDELKGAGATSSESTRQKMRRRVKVKHRPNESMEDKQPSRLSGVITKQLAPKTMELPSLSNSPPSAGYGSGWIDPMSH